MTPYCCRNQRIASGIQRLARGAHAAEALRIARAGVLDRHHRAHRRRGREDVRHLVAAEEVELLVRVEAALTLVDALHGAETPGPEERRDAGGPGPLAHPVESLAVLHLVAVDELLVGEDVAMRVDDALRQARRPRRVVELRRIVGRGVGADEVGRGAGERVRLEDEHVRRPRTVEPRRVRGIGDEQLAPGVREAVPDAVVAVEHRHREQDRAELPDAEEDRGRLRGGGQHDGDAVAPPDPARCQRVRRLVREILELAPVELAVAPSKLSQIIAGLSAGACRRRPGDVVPRRHLPTMGGAHLVVPRTAHIRVSAVESDERRVPIISWSSAAGSRPPELVRFFTVALRSCISRP